MCRAWSKFGFYANSGAVSFKQNSKMKIPPHQPAVADRPLAADAVWRLGAGDWAPPPPGLANRVPLTPPQPPIHSSTPKSSPSYPQHAVAAHPPWASSSPMAIPTAAALHPSCHRCHLPRPQPHLPNRPADPIRPPKVAAAGCCGPCQPACVAGLPRAVVGQAEATGGGCTSSPPCRAFTSLQHRAAGAAYAADTGRHGQAASERHQPGCNCVWVRAGPGAAPPPLVVGRPLARPLPMAGVGFPLPPLFLPVKHREEEGELIPVLS